MRQKRLHLIPAFIAIIGVIIAMFTWVPMAHAKEVATITSASLTETGSGDPATHVDQWTGLTYKAAFSLPDNTVSKGDTTTISLPEQLMLQHAVDFPIKDAAGDVIATAHAAQGSNMLTLTFTDFAESHSGVKGSLHVAVKINQDKARSGETFPVTTVINGQPTTIANVTYTQTTVGGDEKLGKISWFDESDPTVIHYYLRVNTNGLAYKDATVVDTLQSEGMSYVPGSLIIEKGRFVNAEIQGAVNVTPSFPAVNMSGRSFSIHFGKLSPTDQFAVSYKVKLAYTPVNGETFDNSAALNDVDGSKASAAEQAVYQSAGGEAEGQVKQVRIVKSDKADGKRLAGAVFTVTRDRSGKVVATVTTDARGEAVVSNLLRDGYTIAEVKAPEGYKTASPVKVAAGELQGDGVLQVKVEDEKVPAAPPTPDKPDTPKPPTPDKPNKPSKPSEPVKPDQPKPSEPTSPAAPGKPDKPAEPSKPAQPTPDKPSSSVKVVEQTPTAPEAEGKDLAETGVNILPIVVTLAAVLAVAVGLIVARKRND